MKNRFFRVNFLNTWRYYDYLLARVIVLFFIYLLNLGRTNLSKTSTKFLNDYFFASFDKKWSMMLRKNPKMSVYFFVRYYIKNLVLYGFDSESEKSTRLHSNKGLSDFSSFLSVLKKTLHF